MNKKMFVELSKAIDERVEMVIEKFNIAIEEYESNGATEQYVYLRVKEDYDKILNGVTIFTMFKTVRMLKWIAKTYNYCLASNEVLLETARENDMIDEDEMKVNANGYEFNE